MRLNTQRLKLIKEEGKCTRSMAAKRLDVSIAYIQNLEKRGLLIPVSTHPILFNSADVDTLEPPCKQKKPKELSLARRGNLAAKVFKRFRDRQALTEIVAELRVPPEYVRAMYQEWCTDLESARKNALVPTPVPESRRDPLDYILMQPISYGPKRK